MKRIALLAITFLAGGFCAISLAYGYREVRKAREVVAQRDTYITSYENSLRIWDLATVRPNVMFVGDSITNGAPWNELLDTPVAVMAAGGSTSELHLSMFIPQALKRRPQAVYILSGINDISMKAPPEQTAANIRMMADALLEANIAVYVWPVFPVTASYNDGVITNTKIEVLNAEIARKLDGSKAVLLPSPFQSPLPSDQAFADGLHLSAAGYSVWLKSLRPLLSARH